MSVKLKLNNVRLSFPNLFEAKAVGGEGSPRFSAVFLFDPGGATASAVEQALVDAATEKWGAKAAATLKSLRATDKVCVRDGDLKSDYEGFAGQIYLSANNPTRPTVLDADKSPLVAADGRPYAGCYVNAVVEIWAQDNQYGRRVNALLKGVQFAKDGDAFAGGGVASEDDFDDVTAGATADDLT